MPSEPAPAQASRCFAFEQDFVGHWRCIPLCLRRKLDLAGVKLKLSHWLALSSDERQQLVDWPDDPAALAAMAGHLLARTAAMPEGAARPLPLPHDAPWRQSHTPPPEVVDSAAGLGWRLEGRHWEGLSELERFALCKLARPGHDHHNLRAALQEFLGQAPTVG